MYNYQYRFPLYGEDMIFGTKFTIKQTGEWTTNRFREGTCLRLLPFLIEIPPIDGIRHFLLERANFETEVQRIAQCGALPDTLIENLTNPDIYEHISELIYVYEDGKLYYRKALLDILNRLYRIIVTSYDNQPISCINPPFNPEHPVRGFIYLNGEDEDVMAENDKQNHKFGALLDERHPYNFNPDFIYYNVCSETDSDSNNFIINIPENQSTDCLTDPNYQILFHINPVLALAPDGTTYRAAVINTFNRGFEFVGIQKDGAIVSYGPVNVPILMGSMEHPLGVYIPTNTPEPMKAVFKGIMEKVEERLGRALSAIEPQ